MNESLNGEIERSRDLFFQFIVGPATSQKVYIHIWLYGFLNASVRAIIMVAKAQDVFMA